VGYRWPTGTPGWCIAVYRTKNSQTKQKPEDKVHRTLKVNSLSSLVLYAGRCSDKHTSFMQEKQSERRNYVTLVHPESEYKMAVLPLV
jgi:hypothetical protein